MLRIPKPAKEDTNWRCVGLPIANLKRLSNPTQQPYELLSTVAASKGALPEKIAGAERAHNSCDLLQQPKWRVASSEPKPDSGVRCSGKAARPWGATSVFRVGLECSVTARGERERETSRQGRGSLPDKGRERERRKSREVRGLKKGGRLGRPRARVAQEQGG